MTKSKKDPQARLNLGVSILSIPLFPNHMGWPGRGQNMILFPPPTIVARGMMRWVESGDFVLDFGPASATSWAFF